MVHFKINREDPGPRAKPGRSPRRRVLIDGMLDLLSTSHAVAVRNLSCTGALIECDAALTVGAEGVLRAEGLDRLCRAIWRKGKLYGVAFDEPLATAQVVDIHRITEHDLKRAETEAARDWFRYQAN